MDCSSTDESEISDRLGSERPEFRTFTRKINNNIRRSWSVLFYRARSQALTASAHTELSNLETFSNITLKDHSSPGIGNIYSVNSALSSSPQSSTGSFLAITGLGYIGDPGSDIHGNTTSRSAVPRAVLPASRRHPLDLTLADPRHLRAQAVSTQSELAGHEPRHVFERKVLEAFPERGRPPTSSNVFILLTDSKGQILFVVNTRSSDRRRRRAGDEYRDHPPNTYPTDMDEEERIHLKNNMNKRIMSNKAGAKNCHPSCPPVSNMSTQVALMRVSNVRNGHFSGVQRESRGFCVDKTNPRPRCSYVRNTETLGRSSDEIVFHYRTEKATFDLHRESDNAMSVRGRNVVQSNKEETSTQTSDYIADSCEPTPPRTVANTCLQVSFCNKGKNNDNVSEISFTHVKDHFKNTEQQLGKILSICQSTSTENEHITTTHSSSASCEFEKHIYDKNKPSIPYITNNRAYLDPNIIKRKDVANNKASKININIESAKEIYNVSIKFSERTHAKVIKQTDSENKPSYENPRQSSNKDCTNKNKVIGKTASVCFQVSDDKINGGKGFNSIPAVGSSDPSQSTLGSSEDSGRGGNPASGPSERCAAERQRDGARHHRGDGCLLPDPLERDREICRLLGVDRRYPSRCRPRWPCMFSGERNNFIRNARKMTSSSPGRIFSFRIETEKTEKMTMNNKAHKTSETCHPEPNSDCPPVVAKCGPSTCYSTESSDISKFTAADRPRICSHEPIDITQSEYLMIKRSLQQNPKVKTDHGHIKKNRVYPRKNSFIFLEPPVVTVHYMEAKFGNIKLPVSEEQRKFNCKSCFKIKANTALYHLDVDTQTYVPGDGQCSLCRFDRFKRRIVVCNTDCTVLNIQKARSRRRRSSLHSWIRRPPGRRNAMSSMEVYNRQNGPSRPATCSLFNLREAPRMGTSNDDNCTPSVFTLFKGKNKLNRCTPNLGTSTFTLSVPRGMQDSELGNVNVKIAEKNKSFIKRLWRFVAKKKSKDAACQNATKRQVWASVAQEDTLNSSVDSYYINSSLEGIEVTSSIYDTSVSQFSQHTVVPTVTKKNDSVTKKIRRYWNKS